MNEKLNWMPPFYLFGGKRVSQADSNYRVPPLRDPNALRRILFQRTLSGTCTFYLNGERRKVASNEIFVADRHAPIVMGFEEDDENYHFDWVSVGCLDKDIKLPDWIIADPVVHVENNDKLLSLYERAVNIRAGLPYNPLYNHSILAYELLMTAIMKHRDSKQKLYRNMAELLKQELEEHVSETITIQNIAAKLGYTPEALTRLFKKEYGTTPLTYLKHLRIQKASELVLEGQLPLKQIATSCGFSSHNYFSRSFKQITGLTPDEFRKKH